MIGKQVKQIMVFEEYDHLELKYYKDYVSVGANYILEIEIDETRNFDYFVVIAKLKRLELEWESENECILSEDPHSGYITRSGFVDWTAYGPKIKNVEYDLYLRVKGDVDHYRDTLLPENDLSVSAIPEIEEVIKESIENMEFDGKINLKRLV